MLNKKKHINLFSPHGRLRQARLSAGFTTAASACRRFKWKVEQLRGHESGRIEITNTAAQMYADAFKIDPSYLLHDASLNNVFEIKRKLANVKKKPKVIDKQKVVQLRVDLNDPDKKVELLIHEFVPFDVATKIVSILRREG